ncbi:MAG: TetR/AcrR family transcriptional regulator [Acidimicrobiales bacterium]|nr:TetR/AcrR family transcriptional regulator [Acidimicrobiales bacterium]
MSRRVRPHRRDQILTAATALFRTHGFHAVGVDEIGSAAGISGPGVYRHFTNKQALLVAIFDRVADDLVRQAQRIEEETERPADALRVLVAQHVDFALTERALIAVYTQEERSLPASDRRRIRKRQRLYLDHWVRALREARPEADEDEAVSIVHAAIHVVSSVAAYEPTLPRDRLRALLVGLAERVLLDDAG